MNKKILINMTRGDGDELYEYLRASCLEKGMEIVKTSPADTDIDGVIEKAAGCRAIVSSSERWTRDALERLWNTTEVGLITRMGVGVDNIDLEAAKAFGIRVSNTPGANADAVAEGAVSLMLDVMRAVSYNDRRMRGRLWKAGGMTSALIGKTVGIIGFGHIGRRVHDLLRGFDCHFLIYEPYMRGEVPADAELAGLDEVVKGSDVLTLHLPLMDSTRHIADARFFSLMKKTAFFINTSRGGVVDEKALADALENGEIAGAGLDVYENEPEFEPRLVRDDTVLTPHVLSATRESAFRSVDMIVSNIESYFGGEPNNTVV